MTAEFAAKRPEGHTARMSQLETALTPLAALEKQAVFCERNGAPITAGVCRAIAGAIDRTTATGRCILDWPDDPIAGALPLRAVAGFHALHRAAACPALAPLFEGDARSSDAALRTALALHDDELVGWLDGPPQTNEPGRSAGFMAALLVVADRFGLPFDLLEIGSSAGLNLLIDRYRYRLGGVEVGPQGAPLTIVPDWRGAALRAANVAIASVQGVEIAPIDLSSQAAAERLLAYVWVDHAERIDRLQTAITMLRANPPRLDQGDAAEWVEARLAEPQPEHTTRVLMHSVVWQYLPIEGQQRITVAMLAAAAAATDERPLAWIEWEVDRARGTVELHLTAWPGGRRTLLATAHPHGTWIDWLGEELA